MTYITPKDAPAPLIKVSGVGTQFTQQLKIGDKIRPPGTAIALKMAKLVSDTEVVVDATDAGALELPVEPVAFDILPKVDQKVVYEKVLDKLASGGTIGIFPEGGSHDRTDLLPLKVGIALIAYNALEKDGINIPIIPIGLNYFQGHKFRARAVVEYGRPIYIDPKTLPDFVKGGGQRRHVCNELLARIEDAMKSVLTTTPDYQTLQQIHTARRLYQRKELLASEKQDMNRRFAEGFRRLVEIHEGTPPQDFVDLQTNIQAYRKELQELGIRDYQVAGLDREETEDERDSALRTMRLLYQIFHMLFCMAIAALPTICLNLPVGLISRLYAERRRKKALAKSKVKIHARDVMMTEKVLLSIVLVPTLWVIYAFVFYFFISDRNGEATVLFTLSMPLFSYTSIIVAESGMVGMKDLRPYLMRLVPSTRRRLAALPATRKTLQKELRTFVKKLGPSMGELYYGKKLDWNAIQEKRRQSDTLRRESEVDLKMLLKEENVKEPELQQEGSKKDQ
uniref:Phospholipid/glycerol acyltransferase domain-containing protein n=1 Tax=Grammatophora oceanica TaxID=210454 RepID=A0A7S1VRT6_9STRA